MIKGSIQEKDTILNISIQYRSTKIHKANSNNIKGETDSNNTNRGHLHSTYINGQIIQAKNYKETLVLNDRLVQINLIVIHIQRQQNSILFKSTWNILQDISHARHKIILSKFKKTETIRSIFLQKKTAKHKSTRRLNNMLLNNQWIIKDLKEEIFKIPETNENKNIIIQNLWGCHKSSLKREFYSNTSLLQETRKNLK